MDEVKDDAAGDVRGSIETGRLFQHLARDFSERVVRAMAERGHDGLKPYHTILITSLDPEGTRVTELATRAGIAKQTMGQIARELEEQGYVRREPDTTDRRAVVVCFTESGRELMTASYEAKRAVEASYADALGPDGLERLRELLGRLTQDVR